MKLRLHSIFSLLIFVGLTDLLVAESKLLERIPNDSVLVVSLDDWSDFSEKIEDGPLGLFSQSPAWGKMSEWMEEEFESEFGQKEPALEEMIDRMKEWKDSFNGGMILSIGGIEQMAGMLSDGTEFKDMPPPTVVFLIETEKTDKDLVQMLRWMKKEIKLTNGNFEWDRSTIEETQVHWIGANKGKDHEKAAVFVNDDVLHFIFGGEEPVREALYLGSGDDSSKAISDSDQYMDLFDEIGEGDARVFMNFKPLLTMMEQLAGDPKFELPENPFGIKTKALVDALGLNSLDCLGLQIDLSDKSLSLSAPSS